MKTETETESPCSVSCGWDGKHGKCTRPAVWECLLYEGHDDEEWVPFCGHHYSMARFHGWKIRQLSKQNDIAQAVSEPNLILFNERFNTIKSKTDPEN